MLYTFYIVFSTISYVEAIGRIYATTAVFLLSHLLCPYLPEHLQEELPILLKRVVNTKVESVRSANGNIGCGLKIGERIITLVGQRSGTRH